MAITEAVTKPNQAGIRILYCDCGEAVREITYLSTRVIRWQPTTGGEWRRHRCSHWPAGQSRHSCSER